MNAERLVKVSRYLSKHLRHQPERLGLTLAPGGWVEVDVLLEALLKHNFAVSRAELDEVVANNDKQRFSFDDTGLRIRANQGHSVEVDLQLEPAVPPSVLFHGTGAGSVENILKMGLLKFARHHVHLSADMGTVVKVGARHGKPVVFEVDAAAMHSDSYEFFCSENGVWLVDEVPPQYLKQLK